MIEYFIDKDYFAVKRQRKKAILIYLAVLAVYAVICLGLFLWYRTMPYMSPKITTAKILVFSVSAVFVIFSFIYLGIIFKRVNRYHKLAYNIMTGIKETSTGTFVRYEETVHVKDGVDFKLLIFSEWNKYKRDFYERQVYVFVEMEFPKFEENQNIKYVTVGNVLISYEILS